jgi:endonuclease/exonuclease/phosphatase (EEP) superfamily protein YafD
LLQEFGLYYKWPDVGAVAKDFSERTGLKHYDFTPHPGNIFGTACFSKHPILEVDTIFQLLSVTNEAKRYTLEVYGDFLTVVNAHLMSYNFFGNDSDASWTGISETIAARSEQALQIQHAGFDLMFGDLNAAPGDGVYRQIRAHHNDAFQGMLEPTHEVLPARIDHCFYTDQWRLTAADYRIDFPSDHKALLVAFERNK